MPKETFFLKKLLDYGYDYINHISVSLFLFIILTVLGLSCNTEKQIAKKDNAALERVKAKNTLLNAAGNEWVKNHPCVEPTIKPGKPDTITETYIDTAAIQQLQAENDSLFSLIKRGCLIDIDSLKKEWQKYNTFKPTIKKQTITIVDTVPDARAIQIITDSLNHYKLQNWQKDGQILTLKNNVLDAKSETKKWLWWFIGACAFIIVENGLILYLRSKGLK